MGALIVAQAEGLSTAGNLDPTRGARRRPDPDFSLLMKVMRDYC